MAAAWSFCTIIEFGSQGPNGRFGWLNHEIQQVRHVWRCVQHDRPLPAGSGPMHSQHLGWVCGSGEGSKRSCATAAAARLMDVVHVGLPGSELRYNRKVAQAMRPKADRCRATKPIFLLVPRAKLPNRRDTPPRGSTRRAGRRKDPTRQRYALAGLARVISFLPRSCRHTHPPRPSDTFRSHCRPSQPQPRSCRADISVLPSTRRSVPAPVRP